MGNENTMDSIETIVATVKYHLDNPDWLSKASVMLSAYLFTHNAEMSHAELEEMQAAVNILEEAAKVGGKVSVAESEKRAVIVTGNKYGKLKADAEAILQLINACKSRVKVLEGERIQPEV